MKIKTLLLAFASFCTFTLAAQNDSPDITAIKATLRPYLEGDTVGLDRAFLPEGQMLYVNKGKTTIVLLRDFVVRLKSGNGPGGERNARIVSIDVNGNAAAVHIEILTDKFIFNDYMNLLQTENGWQIVNKIFYRAER